jgi:hypothetical protein
MPEYVTTDAISVPAYESSVDDFDVDRAVADLAQLRAIKAALSDWDRELCEWIGDALGRNQTDVDGVGHVEVKRGAARKEWDSDALIRLVIAKGRDERKVDVETGEVLESEGEAVGRALMECARPNWRVTALRARGIDADEYCSTSPGRVNVILTPMETSTE